MVCYHVNYIRERLEIYEWNRSHNVLNLSSICVCEEWSACKAQQLSRSIRFTIIRSWDFVMSQYSHLSPLQPINFFWKSIMFSIFLPVPITFFMRRSLKREYASVGVTLFNLCLFKILIQIESSVHSLHYPSNFESSINIAVFLWWFGLLRNCPVIPLGIRYVHWHLV